MKVFPSFGGIVFRRPLVIYAHPKGGHVAIRMCAGCWSLQMITGSKGFCLPHEKLRSQK